jgi:trans-2,3-dihydro-3-hydroxyanthranilate isomerase
MKYTFQIVDVFSSTAFGGNQLAVLPDASSISTEGMEKIVREFNFGETTFVLPKKDPPQVSIPNHLNILPRLPSSRRNN